MKHSKKKSITGWTIKIWWDKRKHGEFIDTTDMPDDVAQGIDDYLYEKFERSKKTNRVLI